MKYEVRSWLWIALTVSLNQTSDEHAFCFVDISLSHGSRQDIASHVATAKHTSYANARDAIPPISAFFGGDNHMSVIRAETLLTGAIVAHNLPVAFADHFGQLLRHMCPD